VAIGQLGSQLMAITVGADKTAALWQVRENGLSLVGRPEPSYGGSFLECLHLPSDSWAAQLMAITVGLGGTALALWQVGEDGLCLVGRPQFGHSGFPVTALAVGKVRGQPVALTRGANGTVVLWHGPPVAHTQRSGRPIKVPGSTRAIVPLSMPAAPIGNEACVSEYEHCHAASL